MFHLKTLDTLKPELTTLYTLGWLSACSSQHVRIRKPRLPVINTIRCACKSLTYDSHLVLTPMMEHADFKEKVWELLHLIIKRKQAKETGAKEGGSGLTILGSRTLLLAMIHCFCGGRAKMRRESEESCWMEPLVTPMVKGLHSRSSCGQQRRWSTKEYRTITQFPI